MAPHDALSVDAVSQSLAEADEHARCSRRRFAAAMEVLAILPPDAQEPGVWARAEALAARFERDHAERPQVASPERAVAHHARMARHEDAADRLLAEVESIVWRLGGALLE